MNQQDKNLTISQRIAQTVNDSGGRVFYVGGYVRDKILGRSSKDIDIEIHGVTESRLKEILDDLGEHTEMGASFGILGLRHYSVDIVLPRAPGTDEIDPFTGFLNAAKRRDFTMNALMQDVLTGEILDFYGGVDDIRNRIIRHVDDSTFLLDPLRVIRAARFSATFRFTVDDDTRGLCASADISHIVPERIFAELENVLTKSESPSRFLTELSRMNQTAPWFAEVSLKDASILDIAAKVRDKSSYIIGFMLALLCHGWPENRIALFLSRLTNDTRLTKYVLNMAAQSHKISLMPQDSDCLEFLRVFDEASSPEDLPLMSEILTGDSHADILRLYRERMSQPYVTGGDILRLGVAQGPEVGEILRHVHELRLKGVPKAVQLEEAIRRTGGENHD